MVSGVLSGSLQSTDNPVRKVADGSVNLGYTVSEDIDATTHSGSITLTLTVADQPVAFALPRCDLASGTTLLLQSMDDLAETNLATIVSATTTSGVEFFKEEITPGTDRAVWRLIISGASGLEPAKIHEAQLALTRMQFGRAHQMGVDRTRVRQYTRIPVPGGQPFVKRDGPRLRKTGYSFTLISGAENQPVRDFVDAVEGGEAFTIQDDLGACYWAELLGAEVPERDDAGVSSWGLVFQEIRVQE